MKKEKRDQLSVFMSLILRHKPEKFGVTLDENGFCSLEDLMTAFQNEDYWKEVSEETVLQIVKECKKQRYEVKENQIRARYGHSKPVKYIEKDPPSILYHGTNKGVVQTILKEGIKMMERHVHLSETTHFATLAGKRRGEPVLIKINAPKAKELGTIFYYAGGEVWLSTHIHPDAFISIE